MNRAPSNLILYTSANMTSLIRVFAAILLCSCLTTAQNASECNTDCPYYLHELYLVSSGVSNDVYYPGSSLPATAVSQLCSTTGLDTVAICYNCTLFGHGLQEDSNYNSSDLTLVKCWYLTCLTYFQQGQNSALACWNGLPNDISNCYGYSNQVSSASASASASASSSASASAVASTSGIFFYRCLRDENANDTHEASAVTNTPTPSSLAVAHLAVSSDLGLILSSLCMIIFIFRI